jgi:phosphopantothenoylcysteine decarboxylase/phosphopantothenate--cysteine ligase
MLSQQKIILGITGSIAAYKAAVLLRLLVKNGAEVRPMMTPDAKQFVAPLTFATLAKTPVPVEFFNAENGAWNSHVAAGEWATMMLIAPATANSIAKMACGIADNLLLCAYLAARCPVIIAPAMDAAMYMHAATQHNLTLLKERGAHIIEPASGELASGLQGIGRMAEPENIVEQVIKYVKKKTP